MAEEYLAEDMVGLQNSKFTSAWVVRANTSPHCQVDNEPDDYDDDDDVQEVQGDNSDNDDEEEDDEDDDHMGADIRHVAKKRRARPISVQRIIRGYSNFNFNVRLPIKDTVKSPHIMQEIQRMSDAHPEWSLLTRVALRYAHTPASSASTERVWSKATQTLDKNRRHTTGPNAAALIMLSSNQHELEDMFNIGFL